MKFKINDVVIYALESVSDGNPYNHIYRILSIEDGRYEMQDYYRKREIFKYQDIRSIDLQYRILSEMEILLYL